ncbi:MAG: response regulator [Kiritimatiellae bacterium]|nr:response regulator [Kiritimatiellia bacterium]
MPASERQHVLLLVDDDPDFRRGMLRLFRHFGEPLGLTVLEAAGGEEALQMLAAQHVDCVLLDYMMPGGSGIQWLQKIRALNERVPVIMISGEGDQSIATDVRRRGATDYLLKTAISPESLMRAIAGALKLDPDSLL